MRIGAVSNRAYNFQLNESFPIVLNFPDNHRAVQIHVLRRSHFVNVLC